MVRAAACRSPADAETAAARAAKLGPQFIGGMGNMVSLGGNFPPNKISGRTTDRFPGRLSGSPEGTERSIGNGRTPSVFRGINVFRDKS